MKKNNTNEQSLKLISVNKKKMVKRNTNKPKHTKSKSDLKRVNKIKVNRTVILYILIKEQNKTTKIIKTQQKNDNLNLTKKP